MCQRELGTIEPRGEIPFKLVRLFVTFYALSSAGGLPMQLRGLPVQLRDADGLIQLHREFHMSADKRSNVAIRVVLNNRSQL